MPSADEPYCNVNGVTIDEGAITYDGTRERENFPELSAEKSFACVPGIPASETWIDNPA